MKLKYKKIKDAITFLDYLDKKYIFEQNIKNQLEVLKNRQKSKACNLGFIGESSSGKSSFINSLLGEDLLGVSVLLDTTKANTIITYGKDKKIEVLFKNGDVLCSQESLEQTIKEYTEKADIFEEIESVIIYYPSVFLKSGINIVDTPGFASAQSLLDEVTKKAINDILDTLVILIRSDQPMSESFKEFIELNISETIDSCLFVLSKLDLLPFKEVDRLKRFCENVIKNNWNVAPDRLLKYASFIDENKVSKEYHRYLIKESKQTRKYITSYIKDRKDKIQYEKIKFIFDKIVLSITEMLNNLLFTYKNRHNELEASIKPDFNEFLNENHRTIKNSISLQIQTIKELIEKEAEKYSLELIDNYSTLIDESTTPAILQEKCNGFEKDFKKNVNSYQKKMISEINNINNSYCEKVKLFTNQFSNIYDDLPIENYNINNEDNGIQISGMTSENTLAVNHISSVVDSASNKLEIFDLSSSEKSVILASLSRSTNLIVAISAGILALIVDSIFGSIKFKKQKEELKQEIRNTTYNCFNKMKEGIVIKVRKYEQDLMEDLDNLFSIFLKKYTNTVNQLRIADQKEKRENEVQQNSIEKDLLKLKEISHKFRFDIIH